MANVYKTTVCEHCRGRQPLIGSPGSPKFKETWCEACANTGVIPDGEHPVWEAARTLMVEEAKTDTTELARTAVNGGEMADFERMFYQRRERARNLLKRGTAETWYKIRKRILERDGHECQVCGCDLNANPSPYECGHLVDRMVSGSDTDDNLKAMCVLCNRLKPVHETLEEYEAWEARVQADIEHYPFCLMGCD